MIAVVPEHLSRLLKSLEGEGVIKRNGNMLIVSNVSDLMVKCERRASPA